VHVILEGPDNAGKTTLAKLLTDACPSVVYYHPGGRPDSQDEEARFLEDQYNRLFDGSKQYLMDRVTSISQQVYNPDHVLERTRRSCLFSLMELDLVLIYCRPSTDRLLRTQDLTWRPGETEEHKQKIIRGQHDFVQRYDLLMGTVPCISYDYEHPSAAVIRTKLVNALNGVAEDRRWFRDLVNRG
jgi:hypothetical protein